VISDEAGREVGAMRGRESLVGAVLDNLPARVAIIDESGTIVAVTSDQ